MSIYNDSAISFLGGPKHHCYVKATPCDNVKVVITKTSATATASKVIAAQEMLMSIELSCTFALTFSATIVMSPGFANLVQ